MVVPDRILLDGNDHRPGRAFFGCGCRERSVDVKVIAGHHVEVVPEFMGIVVLSVDLRIESLHHLHDGFRLGAALFPVGNLFQLFDHGQDDASVFGHLEFLTFRVVVQFYRVCVSFHKRS